MHRLGIAAQLRGLERGEFSAEELTRHYLERIERFEPDWHCFITVGAEAALEDARHSDAQRAAGRAGALTGIPIAHKDLFCTLELPTTCGSRMLADWRSPYQATMVARLAAAGAVVLGKTNMDEFAMGSSTETSHFGPSKNPWDSTKVPGGSSGGSAAAVAGGLCAAATGSDTGGSIRQPAALCGITGIKPTYGRISRHGLVAFASSLDQAGPMARSAEDAALLLSAMCGFDPLDSTSLTAAEEDFGRDLERPLKGLRIGLPREYLAKDCAAPTRAALEQSIQVFQSLGAILDEVSLPHADLSVATYHVIAPAECSANLSRYDGVRYGYRCEDPRDLEDLYTRTRTRGFGEEVKRRILVGAYVLSTGYYDAYYRQAQRCRRLIAEDFQKVFREWDLLLSPTSPGPAFALGAKSEDPLSMYLEDTFTVAANLAGLPAMSLPQGEADGLPLGLQLIGPHLGEATMLAAAHQYQAHTRWHRDFPPGAD